MNKETARNARGEGIRGERRKGGTGETGRNREKQGKYREQGSKEEQGRARKSKEEQGRARKSKEEQGRARKSKEEQGRARKSKEEGGRARKSKEEGGRAQIPAVAYEWAERGRPVPDDPLMRDRASPPLRKMFRIS
ncbi:hypothetical protein PV433_01970 [Paenibacillus sp. GYB004]|uniref:hypothetical protein n=1 Tax=Paenibacillus sp. GYB004 TaxID=2994393 RepID=UPI002F965436